MEEIFTLFDGKNTGRYMLNVGAPPPHFLQKFSALVSAATTKRLTVEQTPAANGRLMQYGTPSGDPVFLDYLCEFLKDQYQDDVKKENLVQTSGASVALVIVFTQLFPQRCNVYCEQLSYFLAVETLDVLGFKCKGVPSEADGLSLDNLEEQLAKDLNIETVERDKQAGRYSAACYLVPVFQNPNGTVLSDKKCKRIIQLARRYNVLLFCDDVYNFYCYDGQPRKRLFAYDNVNDENYNNGVVISNCTFSKLLAPALRLVCTMWILGWMELPAHLQSNFWIKSPVLVSGGSMNTMIGGVVAELLHSGEAKQHFQKICDEQKEKMLAVVQILRTSLPDSCQLVSEPQGGYFLFIRLPMKVRSVDLVKELREKHDILVLDGKRFLVGDSDGSVENGIRLSVAYPKIEDIKYAVLTICKVLSQLCN